MNKKQRHKRKVERREKAAKIATALRVAYENWVGDRLANISFEHGLDVVRETIAKFLVVKIPALAPGVARNASVRGVVLTDKGVVIDFKEVAKAMMRENTNE